MVKSSVAQPPKDAQKDADRARDGLLSSGLYPKSETPDDGSPHVWLAELAPSLSYADAVALWLAADLLARSPEPGYHQRRQARLEALSQDRDTDPPTFYHVKATGGFWLSLVRRWLVAWLSRSWARRIVSRVPELWAVAVGALAGK